MGCLALLLALAQGPGQVIPPSEFDEVHELELTADAASVTVEYFVDFEGTLHVWTRAGLDLSLEVLDLDAAEIVATDDDSGGGTTPYLRLEVELNDELAITVAAADDGARGTLELHLVAAPETEATRDAARAAREGIAEAQRLRGGGELEAARSRLDGALASLLDTEGATHAESVAGATWDLGTLAYAMGHLHAACTSWGAARDHRERTLPADHDDLLAALTDLSNALAGVGDLADARELQEAVVEARVRTLPADDPVLLGDRTNLALTLFELGDQAGGRALQEAVLEASERILPADHPDLLAARGNFAVMLRALGELTSARRLQEAVLETSERTLPADHPHLLRTRANLAVTLRMLGNLGGARALDEAVLEAFERTLPSDHPDLLRARNNLAILLWKLGDLAGARLLQEAVLEASERTLPADHPSLLDARASLGATLMTIGDLNGARALLEAVLEARERTLTPDHPDLLGARNNLAVTLARLGDHAGARALQEAVLAAQEHILPADHPYLLHARGNLAGTLSELGDPAAARVLQEAVLEAYERTMPADHPSLLNARARLAGTLRKLGDPASACALQEAVLVARERTLPVDHPDLLAARSNLCLTVRVLGDPAAARALVPDQVAGLRACVLGSLSLAPRQACATVRSNDDHLDILLFSSRSADPGLQSSVFQLQETMRVVALEAARALRSTSDPEVAALLGEARSVRGALGDLAARRGEDRSEQELSAELAQLVQERDRLERAANRLLAEDGVVTRPVEVDALCDALGTDGAGVAYRRVAHWYQSEQGEILVGDDHLLVHVLRPDRSLTRIDLGPASELEELVTARRRVTGAPLLRGVRVAGGEGDSEQILGDRLRERLLDPVLAALGPEITRLHVCADDLVFLVPLDVLPFEGGRVGDRWVIVNEVSYARLMEPPSPLDTEPGFFALGGVDYDAGAAEAADEGAGTSRSAMPDRFTQLLQTGVEAQTAGLLFEELLETEPVLLTQQDATKDALLEHAAGKRFVHLATHGWFAPETVRSTADEDPSLGGDGGWTKMSARERVSGMAPMLLCGLALAGANQGRDSLGRMNGILTAEELCGLDLSACELAVLSACETNVGIRRAGQGIQSLQAALYAAGARSSITSLWKVDDAATRRLMELFYTNLWEAEMPKHRALWEAKRVLRSDGAPVRDWAGWVLTGDPD